MRKETQTEKINKIKRNIQSIKEIADMTLLEIYRLSKEVAEVE